MPQRFFRSIKKDIVANVFISEFPEKAFKGIVARYAKALDPIVRTLLTEVHISNPEYELFVGLYADVKFLLKSDSIYFLIPTSAVLIRADGPKVAVLGEEDIIHLKNVTLGLDHGKMMEITSGLKENEKIITNPSYKIIEEKKRKSSPLLQKNRSRDMSQSRTIRKIPTIEVQSFVAQFIHPLSQ